MIAPFLLHFAVGPDEGEGESATLVGPCLSQTGSTMTKATGDPTRDEATDR